MAAPKDCSDYVRMALGKTEKQMPDETIADRVQELHTQASFMGDTSMRGYYAASQRLNEMSQAAQAVKEANVYRNYLKRAPRRQAMVQRADAAGKGGIAKALASTIRRITTPLDGANFSPEGQARILEQRLNQQLENELTDAKLFDVWNKGHLDKETATETSELWKDQGNPGVTGKAQALEIAKIIKRVQQVQTKMQNDEGAWIGQYDGYIARTTHNPEKMWKAFGDDHGRAAWIADAKEAFGNHKTLAGLDTPQEQEAYWNDTYDNLVTGKHMSQDGLMNMKDPAFTGPGNLAKRKSASRSLHPTDAAKWYDYNTKYGAGTFRDAIQASFQRSARDTALMKTFGTNPRAEFGADMDYMEHYYKHRDPEMVRKFTAAKRQALQNQFDILDGSANRPVNNLTSKIFAVTRMLQIPAKLGNVALAHFSVIPTTAAELNRHGINEVAGHLNILKSIPKTPEGKIVMRNLLADNMGLHHVLAERLGSGDDSLPGTVSKLNAKFMRATGLPQFMNRMKTRALFQMGERYGSLVGKAYDALPANNQLDLRMAGIKPQEWEMLRNAPDHDQAEGLTFLTAKAADRIPDPVIRQHLELQGLLPQGASEAQIGRLMQRYRDTLGLKLQGIYSSAADASIVTPGIFERSLWTQGTTRGNIPGELLRSAAQFKMWPTAMMTQQIMGADRGRTGTLGRVAALGVGTMLAGMAHQALQDLTQGKEVRDLNDPRTWLNGMVKGGSMGLLGDYLFGTMDKSQVVSSLVGPVLGQAAQLYGAYNSFKQMLYAPTDKQSESAATQMKMQLFQLVQQNTPFANLFYTKLMVDAAVSWRLQEAIDPGYLQRHEQAVKRLTGQRYWISPSKFVNYGEVAPSQ